MGCENGHVIPDLAISLDYWIFTKTQCTRFTVFELLSQADDGRQHVYRKINSRTIKSLELPCEKTGLRGSRPGLTQTGLYSNGLRSLEA